MGRNSSCMMQMVVDVVTVSVTVDNLLGRAGDASAMHGVPHFEGFTSVRRGHGIMQQSHAHRARTIMAGEACSLRPCTSCQAISVQIAVHHKKQRMSSPMCT